MIIGPKLFERIERKCTVDQMKDTLRAVPQSARAEKKVVLGDKKEDTLQNLKSAHQQNLVSDDELLELLSSAEEYGSQYVFLFRILTLNRSQSHYSGKTVQKRLFPNGIEDVLPSFEESEDQLSWADFRISNDGLGWVAKFYAKRVYEKETRREKLSERSFAAYFTIQDDPIVAVAECDGKSRLEIRISRFDNESHKQKAIWVSRVLQILGLDSNSPMIFNAMREESPTKVKDAKVEAISLSPVMRNMLVSQAANGTLFIPASINFRDSENGVAVFKPDQRMDDLFAAVERQEAVERYLDSDAVGRQMSLKLLSTSQNDLESDVKVAFGGFFLNEFRTDRSLKPKEYFYIKSVIDRFN